jgi:anthranilate synthase component 2
MIVMIDNYDSFTFNLVQLFESVTGEAIEVIRNDAFALDALLASKPQAILLSPGPGTPAHAGAIIPLIRANEDIPMFGVCLGQQAIGEAFGGRVVRGPVPVHGKTSRLTHDGRGLFDGCESPLEVARYHSLVVEKESLPDSLQIDAESDDAMIMALSHRSRPIYGVQFHPESYGSRGGEQIVRNFLKMAGVQ